MPQNQARHVWINGKYLLEKDAKISVFDSAYLYGIGLFETLRASAKIQKNKKATITHLRLWNAHYERLKRNAKTIGLKIPLSRHRLLETTLSLLKKSRLKDATVRMMLSEDEDGSPSLVITAKPYQPYPAHCYIRGARVTFSHVMSADSKTLSPIKTTSYLSKMLPRREALKKGSDEAILLNEKGQVTEGASSSLFLVKKGKIITPPLSDGLLPGTRRRLVMDIARKLQIPLLQKTVYPKDLYSADEIFITSSLKDIMPVGWVEKKKIGRSAPGPVTSRLQAAYQTLILI